ncbi:MAG: agmatine/peptidylarginine deiminase [Gammaproteobacteria bacterium]
MQKLLPEWHNQKAVLMTWPHHHSDWEDDLANIENNYFEIAKAIGKFQPVWILCYDEAHQMRVKKRCAQHIPSENFRSFIVKTNDTWIRDYGPLSVRDDNEIRLLDFQFNAWGGKFSHDLDNLVNTSLFKDSHAINLTLEGGALETDGKNTLLTTASCIFDPKRNPTHNKQDIFQQLRKHFGMENIVVLDNGHLEGDDTDGHIDTLARFCNEETLVYVQDDELKTMENEILEKLSQYNCVALPSPPAIYVDDRRLPATYANFLIINHAVIVPTYNAKTDLKALETLQTCFPDREIIGVDCCALIEQNGSLHCATMQLPGE